MEQNTTLLAAELLKLMMPVHAYTFISDFVGILIARIQQHCMKVLKIMPGMKFQHLVKLYYELNLNNCTNILLFLGGSISHHHGIGKIRTQWYKQSVSQIGVNLYKSVKIELDPKNIFALDNILPSDEKIDFEKLKSKL